MTIEWQWRGPRVIAGPLRVLRVAEAVGRYLRQHYGPREAVAGGRIDHRGVAAVVDRR